jgi:hypothetical protein
VFPGSLPGVFVVVTVLLLAASEVSSQQRAPKPEATGSFDVHVVACVRKGVEGGCLIVADSKSGKTYDITSAPAETPPGGGAPEKPRPEYLIVDLYGNICKDCMGICMQGVILKDIKWSYTKQRCPAPGKKGA